MEPQDAPLSDATAADMSTDASAEPSADASAAAEGTPVTQNEVGGVPGSPSRQTGTKMSWRDKLNAKLGKTSFDADAEPVAPSRKSSVADVPPGKPLSKQETALLKLKQKVEAEEQAREKAIQVAEAVGECYQIERTNMLNMAKIGIKTLIESSIGFGALGETHHPLKQFCALVETIISHGVKQGTSIRAKFAARKGLWGMLEAFEAMNSECATANEAVRAHALLKTNVGRVRAWIRIAMEQKSFPNIMRDLVSSEAMLLEWYEPHSFMVAEENTVVFSGLLVSLNTIDYAFNIDPFMLDGLPPVLDYSMYLKDGNYLRPAEERVDTSNSGGSSGGGGGDGGGGSTDGRFGEDAFIQLQNQKSMLEEKNRVLSNDLSALRASHEASVSKLGPMEAELAALKVANETLEREKLEAGDALKTVQTDMAQKLTSQTTDIETERQTYEQSREGLNEMYSVMQKQLDTERALREDVEMELNRLLATKKELEEKIAAHEQELERRQGTADALRVQLKETKEMNLTMLTNVQDAQLKVKDSESAERKMAKSIAALQGEQQDLMVKLQEASKKRQQLESTVLELSSRLQDVDAQRAAMETNLQIERQYRATLQSQFDDEKKKTDELGKVATALDTLRQDHTLLTMAHDELKAKNTEAEQTLVEMGSQFSEEKLRLNEIETKRAAAAKNAWQGNAEASNCKLCQSGFSLTRRKHHCRNCGGIFCNDCSDNKMPLASSSKAVRVCDTCERELLKQMSL